MADSKTILSRPDAEDFVRWILSGIATRPPSKHRKGLLVSTHLARQPGPKYLRGSDLSERLYVSVEALKRAGYSANEALIEVTVSAEKFLGKSKRGRPRLGATKRDFMSKVESVRSMVNAFVRHKPFIEDVVDWRLGTFLWEQKIGVIRGSEYVPDAGRRMHEAWREAMRAVQARTFRRIV